MADVKISGLPASTVPLAGTEVLPIVQGGQTRQVSVNNLTDGRNVTVGAGTVSLPAITTTGDTNTGIFFPAADTIAFTEGGVESMRIDSNGNLGVGYSSPRNIANYRTLALGGTTNGGLFDIINASGGVLATSYTDSTGTLVISADPTNVFASTSLQLQVDGFTRMNISSAGDVTVATGNLIIGTSGKGIDFTATPGTGTSELLSDYEEGTFTATLTAATPPTTPPTVTGHYTKTGRCVTVICDFSNVNTTGASGDYSITGLPFTSANNGANSCGAMQTFQFANEAATAFLPPNSATITLASAYQASLSTTAAGAGKYVRATITYFAV